MESFGNNYITYLLNCVKVNVVTLFIITFLIINGIAAKSKRKSNAYYEKNNINVPTACTLCVLLCKYELSYG